MKLYITFSPAASHTHYVNNKIFNVDCVCAIECDSYSHGREIAKTAFNNQWSFWYTDDPTIEYPGMFSRGVIPLEK